MAHRLSLPLLALLVLAACARDGEPRAGVADPAPPAPPPETSEGAGDASRVIANEVLPFVPAGHRAIRNVAADLNGDGREDRLLLAEHGPAPAPDEPTFGGGETEEGSRVLLVLTRGEDGSLAVAARSDRAVFCRKCGGMFDPLDDLEARRDTFAIHHYGGSGWRWVRRFTFAYAPAEATWVLARAEEFDYHSGDPNAGEPVVYLPRDFGRIALRDFDPETYRGQTY